MIPLTEVFQGVQHTIRSMCPLVLNITVKHKYILLLSFHKSYLIIYIVNIQSALCLYAVVDCLYNAVF